jgi:FkbM family methyltransferase
MTSLQESNGNPPEIGADPRLPIRFRLVLPYLRRELPMWGRVYRAFGGERNAAWQGAGLATVRGKLHGYTMELDLANWSERLSWALGRYHDLPIQLALQAMLRPGDTFVDIGANLGLVTLLASRLVGALGAVVACEPNPSLSRRLVGHVQRNHVTNVQFVGKALGNAPGTAELREYGGHSGWGSLAASGPAGQPVSSTFRVPVVTGDELLAPLPTAPGLVLKIDVEGYEVPVLQGLQRTLAARSPLVFLEVADAHQRRAGHSAGALLAELGRHGYQGYSLQCPRQGLRRRLALRPIAECTAAEVDAVFVRPDGPLFDRLAPLLR